MIQDLILTCGLGWTVNKVVKTPEIHGVWVERMLWGRRWLWGEDTKKEVPGCPDSRPQHLFGQCPRRTG